MTNPHHYNTGIIGNCSFIAHVDTATNIAWMCWPRFDSTFVFGKLLDENNGGEFSLLPEGPYTSHQYYFENTNILCTEIECAQGKYRVTDFAPRFPQYERYFRPLMLVRKIETLSGSPSIRLTCNPVDQYGSVKLKAYPASNHIEYEGGSGKIRLTTNLSVSHILDERFSVLNETKYAVLTYGSPLEAPLKTTCETFLQQTKTYWRQWVKNTGIGNIYQEQVIRSSLALKIHQYEDTGAIIASSTTSLPEYHQSGRNWDYRFCWLRDTYYILQAFNNIGHFEEMETYFNYIANISVNEKGRYQPLYGITGEKNLQELILPLEGYLGNKPVRIGNQASEHIQNDVYGQILISLLPLYADRRFPYAEMTDSAVWVAHLLGKIEMVIDEADAGLWEFRTISQFHCYTYLFHWAGAKAALKISRIIQDEALGERAGKVLARAAGYIEKCYVPEKQAYAQAVGNTHMDASTLQLILMKYLDPSSERAQNHLKAVEKELAAPGGLFYRYKHLDDFGVPETTFLITAFWYVEALISVGRLDDALGNFEQLLTYTNHLGLMSEDVRAQDGSQWGNFPQAYSHVGLMNAAHRLARKIDNPDFF